MKNGSTCVEVQDKEVLYHLVSSLAICHWYKLAISMHGCLSTVVDKYSYLINGEAMSELQAFIANEENTYEQYIEVHTIYIVSDI